MKWWLVPWVVGVLFWAWAADWAWCKAFALMIGLAAPLGLILLFGWWQRVGRDRVP